MKKLSIIGLIIMLTACGTKNVGISSTDKYVIENLAGLTSEEIEKNYMEAETREGVSMFDEGTIERAFTVLYPETKNEIHITWDNMDKSKVYDINYYNDGQWTSKTGIEIGTTYEELIAMNNKNIDLYGFGWDYGGAVMWNDGKMEGKNIYVFLGYETEPTDNKYFGDKIINATPEEIKSLNLTVQRILYKKD